MTKNSAVDPLTQKKSAAKRPSMKDVAELAGVSRTTVSFVLNGKEEANIPPETQERVFQAVKTLGYRPNMIARNLRGQSTQTIGFISDVIATTPFAVRIMQGAQDYAWKHGKLLLTVNTGGDPDIKQAGVNMLLDRQVDGIIYATMYHREANPPQNVRQVPTVLLDCFVADRSLPSVVPDEVLGGYTATKFLIEKGHRKIAFLNDEKDLPASSGRMIGYKKALAEFEIPFNPNLVRLGKSLTEVGRTMLLDLYKQPERPTAVFCYNDRVAMGVYDSIKGLGLSIPDDVAVVGFDNQELVAGELLPGLTTMSLPHYEMGRWAVDHLMTLIHKAESGDSYESESPLQHTLECPIVVRASA